mgnify:FL=1
MAQDLRLRAASVGSRAAAIDEGLRAYMNKVYGMMSLGILITALAAWSISGLAFSPEGGLTQLGQAIYLSPLKWVIMFAPLVVVFAFGATLNRLSVGAATTVFYFFSALMGLSISWIFIAYTGVSIVQTFLATSIAFASLSLYGYTTKRDLSGFGTFLMMGVVGLIVAMLINLFLQSDAMTFVISILGVLIFAGLTAFDT